MTYTIKQEQKNTKAVTLECNTAGIYSIMLLDSYGLEIYRTIKEQRTIDRKKALATYNRYRKEL
jgi:hypothetical protein